MARPGSTDRHQKSPVGGVDRTQCPRRLRRRIRERPKRVSSLNPAMPYGSVRLACAYGTSTIFLRMICNHIEGLDDRFHETGDHGTGELFADSAFAAGKRGAAKWQDGGRRSDW